MNRLSDAHGHGISTTASVILVIIIIAAAALGLIVYGASRGVRSTTHATMKDIGNIEVNGTYSLIGSSLAGTLEVIYPNSSQSGMFNATITNASVTFHCNDSFFVINADGRVIVNLTIVGNSNSVFMDGLRLNLNVDGNLNNITVMPQTVIIYGRQINGEGNQFTTEPLPP
jgi:hypothetical protein